MKNRINSYIVFCDIWWLLRIKEKNWLKNEKIFISMSLLILSWSLLLKKNQQLLYTLSKSESKHKSQFFWRLETYIGSMFMTCREISYILYKCKWSKDVFLAFSCFFAKSKERRCVSKTRLQSKYLGSTFAEHIIVLVLK